MRKLVAFHDGQAVTTSIIIAKGTGNEHASVIKLVRTYKEDLEQFGLVRFEIRARPEGQHGGGDMEYAILNERQATLLITYERNPREAGGRRSLYGVGDRPRVRPRRACYGRDRQRGRRGGLPVQYLLWERR